MFHNGYFETVKVLTYGNGDRASLGSLAYEEPFIALLDRLHAEYRHLGIGEEMAFMLSLTDARNVQLGINRFDFAFLDDHQGLFDRQTLVLPDVLLSAEQTAAEALRPVFDLVWQSAGMERSLNYNAAGEWAPRR